MLSYTQSYPQAGKSSGIALHIVQMPSPKVRTSTGLCEFAADMKCH